MKLVLPFPFLSNMSTCVLCKGRDCVLPSLKLICCYTECIQLPFVIWRELWKIEEDLDSFREECNCWYGEECVCWKWKVTQSCPTFYYTMDCSPPGSSVHRILQARILEWVALTFSRGSSQPRGWTWVSCIAGRFLTLWATRVNSCECRVCEGWTVCNNLTMMASPC